MKTTLLFAIIAALAILVGAYSTIHQQAERERWVAKRDRLSEEVLALQQQLAEQKQHPPEQQADDKSPEELGEAKAELSSIESEILAYQAELVQLKSDRLVAEERARSSLSQLREQVRQATEIELGLGSLQSRKHRIRHHIVKAEEQMNVLAGTIAERQDYAASLDQKIAGLAIREEALNARVALAEEQDKSLSVASKELEALKETSVDTKPASAPKAIAALDAEEVPPSETAQPVAASPAAEEDDQDKSRSKGLYRFKHLSVEKGAGGPGPKAENQVELAARSDDIEDSQVATRQWAAKQYELGRLLVTRGEGNSGTRELNEAVLAFRAALGGWSKGEDGLLWTATQSDLGYALALLGQRQGNVGMLENAALACRHALSTIERDRTPILWATAQYNLGLALGGMAAIKADKALWQNAIKALQQSAEAFANEGATLEADKSVYRLQDAHDQLAALRKAS